jgi:hypothetical protein
MQDAYHHCEELVRAADKDRYLAALFAPADRRDALFVHSTSRSRPCASVRASRCRAKSASNGGAMS